MPTDADSYKSIAPLERLKEIHRLLPAKASGQSIYNNTQYKHLEEVIGICHKLIKGREALKRKNKDQALEIKQLTRALERSQKQLQKSSTDCIEKPTKTRQKPFSWLVS